MPKDPYELSYDMFQAFISNLKTVDNRIMAIDILVCKIKDFKLKLKNAKNGRIQFDLKEEINNYTICIANIYFILHEATKRIDYFHQNYIEEIKEIKEYILLKELEYFNLDDYWLKEYESKKNTINFRDSLKEKYSSLKKGK